MRITEKAWLRIRFVEAGLAALGLVASIWYGYCRVDAKLTEICVRNVKGAILGIWVLLPPIWFWVEYFFIYKNLDSEVRPELGQFKYGQQLSAKIWLAVVSLLTALYFHGAITGRG